MSDRNGRAVATAAAGAFCIAFSAIFVRLAEVDPATAAVFRCAYALPPLGLLAWWERRRFGPRGRGQRSLALIAGVLFAADLIFWHTSIEYVGAGLATVLGNTQVVLVGLLAWLVLGEKPERRLVAATPVVLVGVVLISGIIGGDAYGANPGLGVLFGVLTGISYAGFILILRQGNKDIRRPAGPLFDATLAAGVTSAVAGAALGEVDLRPYWPAHGWLVLLALSSQVVGWLLISISLPRLPAALTSVVLTLQPVGSVILGIVLLSEAPSSVQLVGAGVIVIGLITATVRRRPPQAAPLEGVPATGVGDRPTAEAGTRDS
ncbi:MAG TPA: DMT family transporter [Actinomycetota bacterium]|nr:DMT family transporter [Actinomycetota bacterium]